MVTRNYAPSGGIAVGGASPTEVELEVMGTTEVFLIGRWIKSRLQGDDDVTDAVTLIERNQAPLGTEFPYVLYHLVSGTDMLAGFGAVKTHVNCLYQVDVYVKGTSLSPVETAIRRIYDLLTLVPAKGDSPVETSAGIIYNSVRELALERTGADAGVQWSNYIQQFRVRASAV